MSIDPGSGESPRIRLATRDDAADIAAIYRPAVTERSTSFELEAPEASEMARRIERVLARAPWLVCELESAVIEAKTDHGLEEMALQSVSQTASLPALLGYAYASPHRDRAAYQWTVEVSVYIAAAAQRMGVGRALYTSLLALLALQGFRTALAGITLPNAASERLHEALGFTPLGVFHAVGYKHGQWHDVAWLERALAEREADPQPPRPLPEILCDSAFERALAAGLPHLRSGPPGA